MNDLTFSEPPPARGGRSVQRWGPASEALRARPGEWAIVATYDRQVTASNQGRLTAFTPHGAYDAVSRVVDGEHRVYARYVGNGDGAGS